MRVFTLWRTGVSVFAGGIYGAIDFERAFFRENQDLMAVSGTLRIQFRTAKAAVTEARRRALSPKCNTCVRKSARTDFSTAFLTALAMIFSSVGA